MQQANGRLSDAAYSRRLALDDIKPTEDAGKISVVSGNLGRTYQLLDQYGLALHYYQQAMLPGADDLCRQQHLLRSAQLHCQLQQCAEARKVLSRIEPALLEAVFLSAHSLLQQQLLLPVPHCSAD